jgi:prepilin-type processing-associated H-X9-DG protein
MNDILKPSETLLIVDSGYAIIGWWHATDRPSPFTSKTQIEDTYVPGLSINTNKTLLTGQKFEAVYGRHQNKSINAGFSDGHVKLMRAEDLLFEKTQDGFKNKIHLWEPK